MDNLQGEAPQLCERWCLVHPLLRYILQTLSKLCKSIWLSWISKSALYHEIPMFLGYHNFPMIVFFSRISDLASRTHKDPKETALSRQFVLVDHGRLWWRISHIHLKQRLLVETTKDLMWTIQAWGTVMVELRYLSCSWKWELTESTDS